MREHLMVLAAYILATAVGIGLAIGFAVLTQILIP